MTEASDSPEPRVQDSVIVRLALDPNAPPGRFPSVIRLAPAASAQVLELIALLIGDAAGPGCSNIAGSICFLARLQKRTG